MEDIDSSPASLNPRKRSAPNEHSPEKKPLNLKGTQFMMQTPPDTDQSSTTSPICQNHASTREVSPAPSSTTLSSVEVVSSDPGLTSSATANLKRDAPTASAGQPPKKRRKLTPTERAQQQQEKDVKAAEKAAERARKEAEKAHKDVEKAEEKARKDEDKRIRDEEKRKKAEEKEEKKRDKELKEEQKAQEKLKKERSQMRLGAFFQRPATSVGEPGDGETYVRARSKSLSLEPFDAVADQIQQAVTPAKKAASTSTAKSTPAMKTTLAQPALSDYSKYFFPFQLQTHTIVAPFPALRDQDHVQETFDLQLIDPSMREKYDLGLVDSYASLERQFAFGRQVTRGLPVPSMRRLADHILGANQKPIDLTLDEPLFNPTAALQAVPRRHIAFEQDVRPAYFGTYTKIRSPKIIRKISRNPFVRSRPDTDYDYDSEAEWEEPEEGEDLMDEDDDEAESLGDRDAHEMDEFLDDEDDTLKNRRKLITGDLVPSNTGLCWQDESNRLIPVAGDGNAHKVMRGMSIGVLLPGFSGQAIDPFSTRYWETESVGTTTTSAVKTEPAISSDELMPPPRPPLQARPNSNGTLDHLLIGGVNGNPAPNNGAASTQATKSARKSLPKSLSTEDMEEFKTFVIGNQSNKADLLKELKARFPKLTNEAIKATLSDNFAQVGVTRAEKKWGFVSVS